MRKRERENRIWIINEGGITLVSTHQNITQDDRLLKENGKKEKCVETLHTQICLVPSSFYKHCIHVTKFVRLQNISIRCMSYLSFSSCLCFFFFGYFIYIFAWKLTVYFGYIFCPCFASISESNAIRLFFYWIKCVTQGVVFGNDNNEISFRGRITTKIAH